MSTPKVFDLFIIIGMMIAAIVGTGVLIDLFPSKPTKVPVEAVSEKITDSNGITAAEFSETKEFILIGPDEGGFPYRDIGTGRSDLNIYIGVPVEFAEVPEARTIIIDACAASSSTYSRKLKDGKNRIIVRARLLEVRSSIGTNKIWTTVRQ